MKHWKLIIIGLLLLHFFSLVITQFTAWPEMLFWPYLVLKGWLPYRDIGIAHSPLLVLLLTGFYKVLGVGVWQQQIFSWSLALLIDIIIFVVLRRLFDLKTALVATCFYVFFQVYYDGNGIWFDHALTIFPILIFALLKKQKYLLVGLFWSLAFLTKQTAFWLLAPIFLTFISSKKKMEFFGGFVKGSLFTAGIFSLLLLFSNLQNDYLVWTMRFGVGTLPALAGKLESPRLLVAALFPYTIFIPLFLQKEKQIFSLFIWSIAGAMGVLPRFEPFHFQPALPFLAAAFAITIKKPSWLTFLIIVATLVLAGRGLTRNLFKPIRFQSDSDKEVVRVVDGMTDDDELIFVTNYWDNLYPLTNTVPATRPFIPQLTQYLSQPGFEAENIADLTAISPKIVVRGQFTGVNDPFRFEKINDYIDNYYQLATTIDGIDILKRK